MRYRLVVPKRVQKKLEKIDKRYRERIIAALALIERNPYAGKKLEGERKGQWTYHLWPYRVIYEIREDILVVLVVAIGHRQGVYL